MMTEKWHYQDGKQDTQASVSLREQQSAIHKQKQLWEYSEST